MTPEPLPPRRWIWTVRSLVPCPAFERTRQSIAIHEASHAVVALAFGFPSVDCDLWEDRGEATPGGLPPPSEPDPPPSREVEEEAALWKAAMIYAGVQGQLLALGLAPAGPIRPSDDDHGRAGACLHEVFGCDTPAWYCQRLARSILSERWSAVERIAADLLEHGAVTVTVKP
jgi:hypothetical protein